MPLFYLYTKYNCTTVLSHINSKGLGKFGCLGGKADTSINEPSACMRSEDYSSWFVNVSCVSATTLYATMRDEITKQSVHRYIGFILTFSKPRAYIYAQSLHKSITICKVLITKYGST